MPRSRLALLALACASLAPGEQNVIVSVLNPDAGSGVPQAAAVALDQAGNLLVSSQVHQVWKLTPAGLTLFAGTGVAGSTGDGGAATASQLNDPEGLAVGADGSVYIAETAGHRVRKVAPDGTISTWAGTGVAGFSGDGAQAVAAQLNRPQGLALDSAGNLYIADGMNNRVRKVTPQGTISTFAGGGSGFVDDVPANQTMVIGPAQLAFDPAGDLLILQYLNRVRKVDTAGIASTVVPGSPVSPAGSGDGGPVSQAKFRMLSGLAVDAGFNIYLADGADNRVRRVDPGGIITAFAGTGVAGDSGDGGAPEAAQLNFPKGLATDPQGNVYIAEVTGRVRRVGPSASIPLTTVTITTVPPGLDIVADTVIYSTPRTFQWQPGTTHTIWAGAQNKPGAYHDFVSWSDGQPASHTIQIPTTPITYTATFKSQYVLTISATPPEGGSLTAEPFDSSGYYPSGTSITLTAAANPGYSFRDFTGDLTAATSPQTLVMSAPKTITARFSKVLVPPPLPTLLPPRFWQRADIVNPSGSTVPVAFQAGMHNVLIVHGLGQTALDPSGIGDFLDQSCANVMYFQYPSGAGVRAAGRLLAHTIARLLPPQATLDIVAFDMGGLVARAAIEQSDLNGGVTVGDRVDNLVTIGTPHKGFPDTVAGKSVLTLLGLVQSVPGLRDLYEDSDLLKALNAGTRSPHTRYFAVAGDTGAGTDGLVAVDSALGKGVLVLTAQSTVPLAHSSAIAAGPALPNHASVNALLQQWIVRSPGEPLDCVRLAGNWDVSESATESCTIFGLPEKPQQYSRLSTVTMSALSACHLQYDGASTVSPGVLMRDVTVKGRQVQINGAIGAALPGYSIDFSTNVMTGTGGVCGRTLPVTTSGRLTFTQDGVPVDCTYTGSATLTRMGGIPPGELATVSAANLMASSVGLSSIVSLFGNSLAGSTQTAPGADLPLTLGDASVRFTDSAGARWDAPLFFASPWQINLLVPSGAATGPASIQVIRSSAPAASGQTTLDALTPGIFTASASGENVAAATVDRYSPDSVPSSQFTFTTDPLKGKIPVPIPFGPEGEDLYLTLYATGVRNRGDGPVAASIDGLSVPVPYAGAQPVFPGLDQINIGPLPRALSARGEVPVVVEFGPATSNVVTLVFAQ